MKNGYLDFDEYIKEQQKLGEVGPNEIKEMKEMFREVIQNREDWRDYTTYKRVDVHPDPEGAKMGRPIEQWDLRNRYLHVNLNPTEEWKVQPNLAPPTSTPTSSFVNTLNPNSKFYTNNENTIELVRVIGYEEMSIKQMMEAKVLKDRKNFLDYHLEPALKERFMRMKYPDRPNHPRQRYLLTVKGIALYNELTKGE